AGAEVEPGVVAQHDEEALPRGLVEAELLLELLDQLGIDPARGARRAFLTRTAARGCLRGTGAAHARGGLPRVPANLRDHEIDRSARRCLHDDEVRQHDADERRHDEQEPAREIGDHAPGLTSPTTYRSQARTSARWPA